MLQCGGARSHVASHNPLIGKVSCNLKLVAGGIAAALFVNGHGWKLISTLLKRGSGQSASRLVRTLSVEAGSDAKSMQNRYAMNEADARFVLPS